MHTCAAGIHIAILLQEILVASQHNPSRYVSDSVVRFWLLFSFEAQLSSAAAHFVHIGSSPLSCPDHTVKPYSYRLHPSSGTTDDSIERCSL